MAVPTAAFTLPLLLASMMLLETASSMAAPEKTDVVVVGAGFAGMKAAHDLAVKGLKVIVLEGRDRVGGRVWSKPLLVGGKEVYAELGGAWIHGVTRNPLVALAKEAGVSTSGLVRYDNSQLYLSSGKEAKDAQEEKWDRLYDEFAETFLVAKQEEADAAGKDPGLAAVVEEFSKAKGLKDLDATAFKYEVNVNVEQEYAASASELSLFYDADSETKGGDVFVTGGYQNLVAFLGKGLDVRLNSTVTEIDYTSPDAILIKTAAGSTFQATRVVCAVPLGVLKKGSLAFRPALPASNAKAIQKLGVGLLNKVILVFPRVFWPKNLEFLNRISAAGNGAWQEFALYNKPSGKPILVAFNGADYARSLESKSDAEVVAEVMAVLRKMYRKAPDPITAVVTRWASDPFAWGSYSFLAQGSKEGDRTRSGASVDGRVFFAGEHVRTDFPSTTHGALLSGEAAACAIAKLALRTSGNCP